ncbi:hypothetical protein BDB01DRAFT_852185 [Pilobolus umbonatus]|nr:hypothetical protein BDB01DRAFT_852185 [Pilobolus umbonatus]
MDNTVQTLEHQTAPESTRGLFDSHIDNKKFPSNRDNTLVQEKRSSFNGFVEPTRSKPLSSQHQQQQSDDRIHQRARSASASDLVFNHGNRRNFGLQTLVEEDDQKKKNKEVTVDSLQDMINTLKNLPPIISSNKPIMGHRKQHSMSALVLSGGTNNLVTSNKRLSYNTGGSDMQSALKSNYQEPNQEKRRTRRSQSISEYDKHTNLSSFSRNEAWAEAEAKLMGTHKSNNYDNFTLSPQRPMSRRYSESSRAESTPLPSTGISKRGSLQLPTLSENSVVDNKSSRRIVFNKPLNLSNNTLNDELVESKRLSGHQRRSSRNLDSDWRSGVNNNNRNSFHIVPFTPTRVNFARDDANPLQRRPLFIAHLPFSALPPLFRVRQLVRGTLRVNKRNRSDAYVYCEDLDADIYICGSRDRNRALEGDVVAVRLVDVDKVLREKKEKEDAKLARNGGQPRVRLPDEEDENEIIFGGDEDIEVLKPEYSGVIVAILERAQNQVFSGTLTLMRPNNKRAQEEKAEEVRKSINGIDSLSGKETPRIVWFKATDKRVPLIAIPIEQAPDDFVIHNESYHTRLFVGSMKRWPITSLHPFGNLERELGSVYEISTQTKAILADDNVTDTPFNQNVENCFPALPFEPPVDVSRRDLRDLIILTIDPKKSNVLDDALSVEQIKDNLWEVGVHISDVSYFIKSQSAIDKEARARGVRVDLLHMSVPMIPEVLTEEVTNLVPNKTRLTFSVMWKINAEGTIVDTWYGKTVIKSRAELVYDDVQKILDNDSTLDIGITDTVLVDQIKSKVSTLYTLASTLHKIRSAHGIFQQIKDELTFAFEGEGHEHPISVCISKKPECAIVVEEFLYMANKSVAQKISSQLPNHALLRRHGAPSERKIREVYEYASRHLGIQLNINSAGALQRSIEAIPDPKVQKLVSVLVLKTLQSPKYFCAGNIDIAKYAHYSLNIPLFTHFTSPSTRFADIIVHRQLESTLNLTGNNFSLDRDTVQKLAQHCNVKKDASIHARDQSSSLFLAIYMNQLSSKQQSVSKQTAPTNDSVLFKEAIVVAVFEQYFDIIIPELNLEKRVHLACLPVWRSDFNQHNQTLTMFWRKGVDTTTGKKSEWTMSDDEDIEDDMDEEALLEEMNQTIPADESTDSVFLEGEEDAFKTVEYKETDTVSPLATKGLQAERQLAPNRSVSTPIIQRRPESTRSNSRRASIVRARLSDSTAYSTEQGYQTIKALDKIRVVLNVDMVKIPPSIRILAANPFS